MFSSTENSFDKSKLVVRKHCIMSVNQKQVHLSGLLNHILMTHIGFSEQNSSQSSLDDSFELFNDEMQSLPAQPLHKQHRGEKSLF